MATMRTNAAAALLGVSANTLRSWEQRFGHPLPRRTEGGHRIFELSEIEALKQAFSETGDISSAISLARERGEGPSTPKRLSDAFAAFDEDKADRLLEESLAFRSLERTIEGILLTSIESLPQSSPEQSFAIRYATGWLAAAKRLAPPSSHEEGVIVFDGSEPGSLDCLYVQALELMLRRLGLRTLCLPTRLQEHRVGNALIALAPRSIVLAGSGSDMPTLSRLVHTARQICGEIEVCDFRGAVPDTGASVVRRLGCSPMEAAEGLRQRLLNAGIDAPIRVTRVKPASEARTA